MSKELQYFHKPELLEQARDLYSSGAGFKKAAEKVLTIIGLISSGDPKPLKGTKVTDHGETRMEKCIKYDLPSACRLVTVQDNNKVILLYLGKHSDVDKWLDINRGKKFVVDDNGKLKEIRRISSTITEGEGCVEIAQEFSPGNLYELLKEDTFDAVTKGLLRSTIRKVEKLHCFSTDDEIFSVIDDIENDEKKNLILDIIVLLKENKVDEAESVFAYSNGELTDITEEKVVDTDKIFSIPTDDPRYSELFSHFVKTADYKQWMLFMHPEQKKIVSQDFKGSAKLLGVSGSGKTCVVVKRAVRLAEKYNRENILVVTLNRSLARLIKELVNVVCDGEVANRIHVKPFFNVCQEYLHEFELGSDKLYDDTTWKSHEHIDEIWTEYYRCELNNDNAKVLQPVHDYIIAQGINAESYIREEFDWIRSAFEFDLRENYLSVERSGRSIAMSKNYRKILLQALSFWEEKMKVIGVTDYLGLASALSRHREKIRSEYRCTLVDESQDFGTTELGIIRRLTVESDNDIFICGDAAQRVSTKFQSLKTSGINVSSNNSKKLLKNYRNSKQILTAAYCVFENFIKDNDISISEDFEVLPPEFSSFSGSTPVILESKSLEEEISYAIAHAKELVTSNVSWRVCIAICGYSLYELKIFGDENDIPLLDGDASLSDDSIFLSDLEQTKGFEFDMMIILNASDGIIPDSDLPEKEHYRDLCQFYVALTRAKSELAVFYSDKVSSVLDVDITVFQREKVEDYFPDLNVTSIGTPKKIGELHEEDSQRKSLLHMTGPEYLYTEHAIGLSSSLVSKLRDLIPGRAVNRQGHYVCWTNIGSAYDSVLLSPRSRAVFGSEGIKEFRIMCDKLQVDALIKNINIKDLYTNAKLESV